jgi:hypothetical protein
LREGWKVADILFRTFYATRVPPAKKMPRRDSGARSEDCCKPLLTLGLGGEASTKLLPADVCFTPKATELLRCREISRCAQRDICCRTDRPRPNCARLLARCETAAHLYFVTASSISVSNGSAIALARSVAGCGYSNCM